MHTVEDRLASANQAEMDPKNVIAQFAPKKISVAMETLSFPAENAAIQADGLPPAADDEDVLLSDLLASAGGSGDVVLGVDRGVAKAVEEAVALQKPKPVPRAQRRPRPSQVQRLEPPQCQTMQQAPVVTKRANSMSSGLLM